MRTIRRFVAYYYFTGWSHLSLGLHVCPTSPNIEIHLPFGFIRVGWVVRYPDALAVGPSTDWFARRTFGFDNR